MKKLILLLLLIPLLGHTQITSFPWIENFDTGGDLENIQDDDGDWILNSGGTSSYNTGPSDDMTGGGNYWYVESSIPNHPEKLFVCQTDSFDISGTPGQALKFWYHMYGDDMGRLDIFIHDDNGWFHLDSIVGDQGDFWLFKAYPLDSLGLVGNFLVSFEAETGISWTSDIAIDDVEIGNPPIWGCTDSIAENYDSLATGNDGSCIYILGCMDPIAENYDSTATMDSGFCQYIFGCQDPLAYNYDSTATQGFVSGFVAAGGTCNTQQWTSNYFGISFTDWILNFTAWDVGNKIWLDGNEYYVDGADWPQNCNSPAILVYLVRNQSQADGNIWTFDPNGGLYAPVTVGDYWFITPCEYIEGCTDSLAINYVDTAGLDDGSCLFITGCMDSTSTNYNPAATQDDGTCVGGGGIVCSPGKTKLTIEIMLDQYANETGWILFDSVGIHTQVTQGTYSGFPTGAIVTQEICIDNGMPIEFQINDSYGDGLGGAQFGGIDGEWIVYTDCDTISMGGGDFGYNYSDTGTVNSCITNLIVGCTNPNFVEYNPLANQMDTTFCITPHTYGCTDPAAFNYDSTVSSMQLNPGCLNTLVLTDWAGNGWAGSFLVVTQGNNHWGPFTVDTGSTFTTAIPLNTAHEVKVFFYSFGNSQTTSEQCMFAIINPIGTVIATGGTNPYTDPILEYNLYQHYYTGTALCGNVCIPRVFGCTNPLAVNYNPLANTSDTSCYFNPGCTDPAYLEYHTQGYVADFNDGSCSTYAIFGCTDSTMFNFDQYATVQWTSVVDTTDPCITKVFGCLDPAAFNYCSFCNTEDYSCIPVIYGCMDSTMWNYDITANTDNGSCLPYVYGCTDSTMLNYDPLANTNDGTCIPFLYGCTDSTAINYNALANTDDGSCIAEQLGCTDSTALNYNILANTDDGSCIPYIYGCTDSTMYNYDSLANTNDGSCIPFIYGCIDPLMWNYDVFANTSDSSCIPFIYGCTDPTMWNYDILANTDNGSCEPFIYGCTDTTAFNYDPLANTDNGTCIPFIYGCTDPTALNYDPNANTNDNSCVSYIYGCTDSTMWNYNPLANTDNGTCVPFIYGCTDPLAANWDQLANTNDNSCYYNPGCTDANFLQFYTQGFVADFDDGSCVDSVLYGCMDNTMFNYNANANIDNGSCVPYIYGCMDTTMFNYNPLANTDNGTCIPFVYGCMDMTAANFNPLANTTDGSCYYAPGCTDPNFIQFWNQGFTADYDDGSCIDSVIYGCMDATQFNYNPQANLADGSCIPFIYGCMDSTMWNYNPAANTDNGTCIPFIYGCTDATAANYNPLANTLDGSCYYNPGCTDPLYLQFWTQGFTADYDNGSCTDLAVYGCMNPISFNYNSLANIDDGSCIGVVLGCMDDGIVIDYDGDGLPALNYNPLANTENGTCITKVFGCMDITMFNYNPLANVDNGSCIPFVYGCMDTTMFNYNPLANTQPANVCVPFIYGCMDDGQGNDFNGDGLPALNYCAPCNTNQVSSTDVSDPCIAQIFGCTDSTAFNYDPLANVDNGTCIATVYGCTDDYDFQGYLYNTYPNYIPGFNTVIVNNYDPLANTDDGSCLYYDLNTVTGAGNPYWLNDTCYAWVVYEVDPYCLNNQWDNFCQSQYNNCAFGDPLSTTDLIDRNSIKIYPNPTKGLFIIEAKGSFDVGITDMLGNNIMFIKDVKEPIDIANYKPGVYNLYIEYNNVIYNRRIVLGK